MEVKQSQWKAWLYLAPTIILMIVFTFYPLVNTFITAFKENYNYFSGEYSGIGLGNFEILFVRSDVNPDMNFINIYLKNTALIAVVSVPISIALALIIAVALNSIPKFQKVLQTIFFLPYVTNTIAIGMVFAVMFDDKSGLVNTLVQMFGGDPIKWLGSDLGTAPYVNSLAVLLIYIVWDALPFKILLFLSSLQGIDKQYYQAAQIDGTSKLRTFGRITVPLLSPQIVYLMITSFIGAFKEYNSVISIFDNARPYGYQQNTMATIVWYIYDSLKRVDGGVGRAAAGAVVLFVIIMIITAIQSQVSKRFVHY
ncbi:MAG: sugar ABC transporter permease [Bacilli bacterium]|nr:sugar ABC transporter permease [Bacilli bacterium]